MSTFIPVNEADLVKGESFPAIDRLMAARGYIGAQYLGRDPLTDALYYRLPETNLRYAFVPELQDVVRIYV
jgi:hypothetical protein